MTDRQPHEVWRGPIHAAEQIQSWSTLYQKGLSAPAGTRLGYAIVGLKELLHAVDSDTGMNLTSTNCGDAFSRSVKKFQRTAGLDVDGVVGRLTGKALCKIPVQMWETKLGIPNNWLCKDLGWESSFDPGAVYTNYDDAGNVTSVDRGVAQLNTKADPTVTDAQAYSPVFSIEYLANRLAAAAASFTRCQVDKWRLAVEFHRSPVGAKYHCSHPGVAHINHSGDCASSDDQCWGEQVAYYGDRVAAVAC